MGTLTHIYAGLGRAAHLALMPALRLRKYSPRVRALIISEKNQVLLVRSWFGHQKWSLPGGGIKPYESGPKAATRETLEETGILVPANAFSSLATFANADSNAPFAVDCQLATGVTHVPPHIIIYRRHEILAASWFPLDNLPANLSPNVTKALAIYSKK